MENNENVEVVQEGTGAAASAQPHVYRPTSLPGGGFRGFLDKNRKMLIYTGIGLAAVVAGIVAYTFYKQSQDEEAKAAIFMHERAFEVDSLKQAVPGLQDVVSSYGGTKTANLANLYLGEAYINQGKYPEAIEALEDFSTKSPIFQPLAYGLIGDAYSQQGKYEDAAKYYMKAVNHNNNTFTTPRFMKKAALVYLTELKNPDEALRLYKEIKEKYKDNSEAQDVDKYIARAQAAVDAGK